MPPPVRHYPIISFQIISFQIISFQGVGVLDSVHGDSANHERLVYQAAIGHVAYDSVRFSAAPIADAVSPNENPLLIVEHRGVQSQGMAEAVHTSVRDTLFVNLGSHGRVSGKRAGQRFAQDLHYGHVGFVPRAVDIDIAYPASNGALMLFLPDAMLDGVMAEMGANAVPVMAAAPRERLRQLIALIDAETRAPGFASDLMIDGILRAIATILVRGDQPVEAGGANRVHMSRAKLNRVIDFVEARLDQPLSLEDLARIADLSPFHFSRVFKLTTGETPYHFVCSRRLARAQQLLTTEEMPLAELALVCGFASQSHFTAAFSKAFGTSPGRYRRARSRS